MILCVDDEPAIGAVVGYALQRLGHECRTATSVEQALRAVARSPFDLVLADYQMPGQTGLDLVRLLAAEGYRIPVILMTGYSSVEHAVVSIKSGAIDYLTKPVTPEALEIAVTQALEVVRLRRENESFRRELLKVRSSRVLIGESEPWRRVMEIVDAVAPTRATVLLEGASGTGKELVARALHDRSPRGDGPYVSVNCAALPEGLVESALFGHEKGTFTGATVRTAGAFERAHGGTLLLDEISEMRLDLQSKLLRVIQEQEFERVGGAQMVKVDVRLIATTNRQLKAQVEAGLFRADLYYRLNVVSIRTPSLRDRVEDIPRLTQHFLHRSAQHLGLDPPVLPPRNHGVPADAALAWKCARTGQCGRTRRHPFPRRRPAAGRLSTAPGPLDSSAPPACTRPRRAPGRIRSAGGRESLRPGCTGARGHPPRARGDGWKPGPRRQAARHQRANPPQQAQSERAPRAS